MSRTVERATTIDVNFLNGEGFFEQTAQRRVKWTTDTGELRFSAVATYYQRHDTLCLEYAAGDIGQSPDRQTVEIDIEWTECNFGGERPWFDCPDCGDRVGTLHRPAGDDRFACRDCHGLLYESQTYKRPTVESLDRHEKACERLAENGLSREGLRELHQAKQAIAESWNDYNERLDEKYGDYRDYDLAETDSWDPPAEFDEWAEQFLEEIFTKASGRSYGYHGRCTATSKTTGVRCRQPARGDSGKCYYHGGARGSGIGEEQTNRTVEQARALLEADGVDPTDRDFLTSDSVQELRQIAREKAHV